MTHITRVTHAFDENGNHKGTAVYEAEVINGKVFDLPEPRSLKPASDAAVLAVVMSSVQLSALATVKTKEDEIAAIKKTRDELIAERDAIRSEREALRAENDANKAALKAVNDELKDIKNPPSLVRINVLRRALRELDIAKRWETAVSATVAALTAANDPEPKRIVAWWDAESPTPINSIGGDWAEIIKAMKWPAGMSEATLKTKIDELKAQD